ncbi:hypothetical protein Ndes2437B_g07343 [Nannochloris sp. 'desiccata']
MFKSPDMWLEDAGICLFIPHKTGNNTWVTVFLGCLTLLASIFHAKCLFFGISNMTLWPLSPAPYGSCKDA